MLPALERWSGLEARRMPAIRVADEAALRGYLEERIEATFPADRLDQVAAVYRWLGLLPETLELRSFLLRLYE